MLVMTYTAIATPRSNTARLRIFAFSPQKQGAGLGRGEGFSSLSPAPCSPLPRSLNRQFFVNRAVLPLVLSPPVAKKPTPVRRGIGRQGG